MPGKSNSSAQNPLPHVLVLTGNDTIGRERAKNRFVTRLKSESPDLYRKGYNPGQESFDIFIEQIITPMLFQTVRLFTIQHAQDLPDHELTRLEYIITQDLPNEYVIIEYESQRGGAKAKSFQTRLKIAHKVKKDPQKFLLLKLDKPPDYKLAQWLTNQVPLLFNRTISLENAEQLLNMTGNELGVIYAELKKIDIYLEDNQPIDKATIKKISGISRIPTPFELAETLGQRNFVKTQEIIESLYMHNVYLPSLITTIFKHFWKLLKIRSFAQENRAIITQYYHARYNEKTKIAYTIGVKSGILNQSDPVNKAYPVIVLSGIIDQAKKYKLSCLLDVFNVLRDFDVGIKTGKIKPDKLPFQLLCYQITTMNRKEKDTVSG